MRWKRTLLILLSILLLLAAVHLGVLRPWFNTWGAPSSVVAAELPGDEIVPFPGLESTRSILIHASPRDVWPWLVQIGQGRGGFYSYARLENLFGCEIQNADSILPQHQDLAVGDAIRLHPGASPLPVVALRAESHIVLAGRIDPTAGDIKPLRASASEAFLPASWAMLLREERPGLTRLILRFRLAGGSGALHWLGYRFILEPATFVMERKMLLGIRERTESMARADSSGNH